MTKDEREEAIAIIRKEYLCVDRDCDIERNCGKCELMMPSKEPILKAYKTAIQALEQEPSYNSINPELNGDTISRQAVKEQMIKYGFHALDMTVTEFVEGLPPVNPQNCDNCEVGNPCLYCRHEFEPQESENKG